MKYDEKGFSLLELAVVLVIIGILTSATVFFFQQNDEVPLLQTQVDNASLRALENTLDGFIYANGRLPCPDTNGDGLENGGGLINCAADVGTLPHRTLGLPGPAMNSSRIHYQYGVFRKANTLQPAQDMDLAVVRDRFLPLLPVVGTVKSAIETQLNQINGIDFCQALRTGTLSTSDTTEIHVVDGGTTWNNVAYVLVDAGSRDASGDGNILDGINGTGFGWEVSSRPQSSTYDDTVRAVNFDQLFTRLGCSGVISAAVHSHANTALAAASARDSLVDYGVQLGLIADLAAAQVEAGEAGVLTAAAGLANVTSTSAIATAETILSAGATAGLAALVAAAVAAHAGATVLAAELKSIFETQKTHADNNVTCFNSGTNCAPGVTGNLPTQATALATDIRANAVIADAAGL